MQRRQVWSQHCQNKLYADRSQYSERRLLVTSLWLIQKGTSQCRFDVRRPMVLETIGQKVQKESPSKPKVAEHRKRNRFNDRETLLRYYVNRVAIVRSTVNPSKSTIGESDQNCCRYGKCINSLTTHARNQSVTTEIEFNLMLTAVKIKYKQMPSSQEKHQFGSTVVTLMDTDTRKQQPTN